MRRVAKLIYATIRRRGGGATAFGGVCRALAAFVAALVALGATNPADAKRADTIQIILSDMIHWRKGEAQGCAVVYAVQNNGRRHIGEILFSFSAPDGHYFSDKIYDVRPRTKVDRFRGDSKPIGDDPQSEALDCSRFARGLVDIMTNGHGPNIHACIVDKTPEALCPPMVKIEIGTRFLDNATAADEHPQDF